EIKVEYIQENLTDYRQRLTAAIQSGQGPDVFVYHHSWVPMLVSLLSTMPSGVSQNLLPETVYYPSLLQPLSTRSGLVGLPLTADVLGLYYNKTMFDSAGLAPPSDWEALRTTAKNLTLTVDGRLERAGIALGTTNN